jgi:hypothetical protein
MTRPHRSLSWPLGPLPVALPAGLLFAVTLLSTTGMLRWHFQEWVITSAQFHQLTAFTAPVAGAAATYYSGRLLAPDRVYAPALARRSPYAVIRRDLLLLTAWFVTAYLLGLVPLTVATALHAEAGHAEPLVMLSGVLALVAAVVVGYLAGLLARTALFTPVTFLLLLAVAVAGFSGDTFAGLAPVLHVDPALGQRESTPLVLYRLAFLMLVITVGTLLAAKAVRERRVRRSAPSIRAVGLCALLLMVASVSLLNQPALFVLERHPPTACADVARVQVCVHAGHRGQLDNLVDAMAPVLTAYGVPDRRLGRVYDRALLGLHEDLPGDHRTLWYDVHPSIAQRAGLPAVSAALAGMDACLAKAPEDQQSESRQLALALHQWLEDGGTADSDNAFARAPRETVQNFIARHEETIAQCSLRIQHISW